MNNVTRDDIVVFMFQIKKIYNNFDDIVEKVQLSNNGNLMKLLSIIRKSKSKEVVHDLERFLSDSIIKDILHYIDNDYDYIPILQIIHLFKNNNITFIDKGYSRILGFHEIKPILENYKVVREVKQSQVTTTVYSGFSNILGFDFKIYKDMEMNHNSIFTAKMLGFTVDKISKHKRYFYRDKDNSKILYCNRSKRVGFTNNIKEDDIIKIFKQIKED